MPFNVPDHIEFVWVTSLECDANCTYCFQVKDKSTMSLEDAKKVIIKLKQFIEAGTRSVSIYFQGGEAMALPPDWYEELVVFGRSVLGNRASFHMQTNLLRYNSNWGNLFRDYFSSAVGSSLDWPNLYRRSNGLSGDDYNKLWKDKYDQVTSDGINVGAISLPNRESVKMGARAFIDYYRSIGLKSIQINYLFNGIQNADLPDPVSLGNFVVDLFEISRNTPGFSVSPFQKLFNSFSGNGCKQDFCIHSPSCSLSFLCVRPSGMVSLCDCWVAFSSKETCFFGNFITDSIEDILNHKNRANFLSRAFSVVSKECSGCEYLPFCHGGCPVRAFKNKGDILMKDYYCDTYKLVFGYFKNLISISKSLATKDSIPSKGVCV